MATGLRIEVWPAARPATSAPAGEDPASAVERAAADLGLTGLGRCEVARIFQLDRDPGPAVVDQLCRRVLCDPVVERATVVEGTPATRPGMVEVGFLPGVTDAEARQLEAVIARLGVPSVQAATVRGFHFPAPDAGADVADLLERLAVGALANPMIERFALGPLAAPFGDEPAPHDTVEVVALRDLDAAELLALSRERLLSLDEPEMRAIQAFFVAEGREPTDAELETLAQTWSEHCAHKTFRAEIDFRWLTADGTVKEAQRIDGLLATYLRAATDAVGKDWVRSAFVDNAGIVAYDDRWDLAVKVETHNHPSALEPFGGANTGVGGVVRDVIGVSARPIACLDVLCFAPADTPADAVPAGVLHPARVARGVVAGVGDYGNKLGLPTVAGAVVYDPGYLGNPLVYCGAVGILPNGSNPTAPAAGQRVVVVGGRTGRDGIHGAMFSSATMDASTGTVASSAVQIGDPITEKGVMELVEEARDRGLYRAITDCGAGGLSSAVGELAAEVGVAVDLQLAPRKYAGLAPWEVWLSESQERMVLAVPPEHVDELVDLGRRWSVEVTAIGTLTGDGRLRVDHGDRRVVDLPMAFLHGGCPRRRMEAVYQEPANDPLARSDAAAEDAGAVDDAAVDLGELLLRMLADPSVASKEPVTSTYDHEVRGGTLVRPWCGPGGDGPSDGVALVPLGCWDGPGAFALAVGINPSLGDDPYRMALSAIDEVFRNLVAVGADPDRVALLDNFCWGNPTFPDRLGSLVRATQGCHDGALAYEAPFVSGKDSLYNEFDGRPIPPTLLITGLGHVPDRRHVVGAVPRADGGALYLVGETRAELGGSLLHRLLGRRGGVVPDLPSPPPLDTYRALHRAMQAGLVLAAHDPSEGGLAVALAELAIAGRVGIDVVLGDDGAGTLSPASSLGPAEWLFSESNGRLVAQVDAGAEGPFEAAMAGTPLSRIGQVTGGSGGLLVAVGAPRAAIVDVDLDALVAAFTGRSAGPGRAAGSGP